MRKEKNYTCDDCGVQEVFTSYKKARKQGKWAVGKDYKNCFCPNCAPVHRHGGANKKNCESNIKPWQLPRGFEQLSIEDLK